MVSDYKHRAKGAKTTYRRQLSKRQRLGRRLILVIFIAAPIASVIFWAFGGYDAGQKPTEAANTPVPPANLTKVNRPEEPHYIFYHTLSKKEIVIPEHEARTRSREELLGIAKGGQYMMQAGSFATTKEADALIIKLAAMGIQAKIDKITVTANKKLENLKPEPKTWYRVKIGPYSKMSSVDNIRSRLKKNGIEVNITEAGQ